MRNRLVILSLIHLLMTSCNQPAAVNNPYKLVWSDEFSGSSLDEEYWGYMIGNGAEYGNPGWGNSELQYYKRENVSVYDGELHITAKKETVNEFNYTSARIRTAGKVAFKYGKIEARIKLPTENGMWPAFWMLPEDFTVYGPWPHCGEIDIMEANGGANTSSAALHYSTSTGSHTYQVGGKGYGGRNNNGSIADYHIYRVIWEPEQFDFYVDNEVILTVPRRTWTTGAVSKDVNPNAPFDKGFHILLNMAVGGNYVNNVAPDLNFTEADMVVDYIRVYQYEGE